MRVGERKREKERERDTERERERGRRENGIQSELSHSYDSVLLSQFSCSTINFLTPLQKLH